MSEKGEAQATVDVWRSKDSFVELVISSYLYVSSRDLTGFTGLHSKGRYRLHSPASPGVFWFCKHGSIDFLCALATSDLLLDDSELL